MRPDRYSICLPGSCENGKPGDENQRMVDLLSYLWSRREERVAPDAHTVEVRFTEHVDTMSEQTLNPLGNGQSA